MKYLLAFVAGFITGLAIYQAPRAIAPLFQDAPVTPADWAPKYMISGRVVTKEQFNAYPPPPSTDPEAFERKS